MKPLTVSVTHKISKQRISDILCNAFEGGSNYWCAIDSYTEPTGEVFRSDPDRVWKRYDYPLSEGGEVIIVDCETPSTKSFVLNLESIQRGLTVLAKKYPKTLADVLNENDDAETGDVFLQCCLFGEVIYG